MQTCSRGRGPNDKGVTSSQNSGSSTVSRAISHSVPMASTFARNLRSSPRRLTFTCMRTPVMAHWARRLQYPAATLFFLHWLRALMPAYLRVIFDRVCICEKVRLLFPTVNYEATGCTCILPLPLPWQRVVRFSVHTVHFHNRVHKASLQHTKRKMDVAQCARPGGGMDFHCRQGCRQAHGCWQQHACSGSLKAWSYPLGFQLLQLLLCELTIHVRVDEIVRAHPVKDHP